MHDRPVAQRRRLRRVSGESVIGGSAGSAPCELPVVRRGCYVTPPTKANTCSCAKARPSQRRRVSSPSRRATPVPHAAQAPAPRAKAGKCEEFTNACEARGLCAAGPAIRSRRAARASRNGHSDRAEGGSGAVRMTGVEDDDREEAGAAAPKGIRLRRREPRQRTAARIAGRAHRPPQGHSIVPQRHTTITAKTPRTPSLSGG